MLPRLVLIKSGRDFPTTGVFILWPTLFLFFVVASTVDGIAVLNEGVVADGREVVPGFGVRALVLSEEYVQDHSTSSWGTSTNISRAKRQGKVSTRGKSEEGTKNFEANEFLSGKTEGGWRERVKREARRIGEVYACRKSPFGMITFTYETRSRRYTDSISWQ